MVLTFLGPQKASKSVNTSSKNVKNSVSAAAASVSVAIAGYACASVAANAPEEGASKTFFIGALSENWENVAKHFVGSANSFLLFKF